MAPMSAWSATSEASVTRSPSPTAPTSPSCFLDQMGEFHPTADHWYLPLMGVDLSFQSLGYGSALLRHALARSDDEQLPAYLEATSPRNKALYERHGFEELGVIQAGASPPMWPMLREQR